MADLISRQPPRPYKLPESTQTSGQFSRQQYARPEVLTAGKKTKQNGAQISNENIAKAQNIATRIQSIRDERLKLLFPDAPAGTSFENYKQNELQNAIDTLPAEQLQRYNWLMSKDQQLRGELTKIIGDQVGQLSTGRTTSRAVTRTATQTTTPQFSEGTQEVVDKYVDTRGRINVMQMAKDAVAQGYNDFKGDKAKQEQWQKAAKDLGIAGEFSEAVEYAMATKIYGDKSGRLDVERMIAEGYNQDYIERLTGINEQQYADIKTTSGYKTDQGNIDVTKMVKELPQADVQRIMGIGESEYNDLKQLGRFTDDKGNVDVAKMIETGFTQSYLDRVIDLSKADYDKIKTQVDTVKALDAYTVDGQLDLVKAIEANQLDKVQQVYDIKQQDLAQVYDYLELKDKGYIDNTGNVDVMQILVDGKVDDRTLTSALQLKPADLATYKTVAKYVDAEGNIDLVKAAEDNALPEVTQMVNVPQADLAKVLDYIVLKDKGYVDPEGKVNVMAVIKDGQVTERTLTSALDISKADYDEYATLAKYMDTQGNIDVIKALDQGVKPELLQKHLDFDIKEIEAIQAQQAAMGKLGQYLDVGIQDKAVSTKDARLLKNPKVDVLTAIKDGVEFETLNKALDMDKADYDNLKELSAYTTKDGNIDVVKALYNGADPDKLQKQLNISDKEMKELVDYAKYEYWEPDKGISVKDLEAKLNTPGMPEWTKVVNAMKSSGVYRGKGLPVDDQGYPGAGPIKELWEKFTPEQKEAVASEWMGSWDRVAMQGEAAMKQLEYLTGKMGSGNTQIPSQVMDVAAKLFPPLNAFYIDPKQKGKVNDTIANAQNWVHSFINTHLREHSVSDSKAANRFAMGTATAVADILAAIAVDIPITLYGVGQDVREGELRNAAAGAVGLAGGMLLFPTTLPKKVLKDKSSGAGYVAGTVATLVINPFKLVGLLKKGRTYVDPYGIPDRMAAIEFSTGRVPITRAGTRVVQDLVTKASKEIIAGKESGVVSEAGWQVKYRTTPIQRAGGSAVWHGSPDITPMSKVKPGETFVVDPASPLFTSPYATPRFVAATSLGFPAVKPGYLMVITDAGKVMSRAEGPKGLTGTYKTYKGRIETEIIANPKTEFTRTKNLRTRILGPKAGEFFTQYWGPNVKGLSSGQLVPIVVMLDKGITGKPLSPATLYAAKLTMIREALLDYAAATKNPKRTIQDIISRRQGPPGVREMEISKLTRALEKEALENTLKKDRWGERGEIDYAKLGEVLRRELEIAYKIRATGLYRELGTRNMETYYQTPEGQRKYEELYVSRMEPVLYDAVRTYQTTDAITRTAVEYTESMPRVTLETTGIEVERELPAEERYVMTVKRRQSLREHPRVGIERDLVDVERDIAVTRELAVPVSREMTAAARADLRVLYDARAVDSRRAPVRIEPPRVPPPGFPPPGSPPPPIEPPKFPPPPTKKKRPAKELPSTGSKKKRPEKPGTIHWRQGLWWISLVPRGRDNYVKVYSKAPPPDAPTHKRTPEETFFIKGGPDDIPQRLKVDMGIVSVKILPTGEPNLGFKRRKRR